MLEGLRAVQNTWVGKSILAIVMGFIVVSFAIWGIGDIFRGITINQVAKVGSVEITAAAFRQAYQTDLQNLQARERRPITNEEAHARGLDAQVLSQMLSDAALDDQAQSLGLAISDAQMGKAILGDPSFAGPGGSFDRNRFNAVLRDNGLNEQSFVREQRHIYLRQEVVQALVGDLAVPNAALEALHRYGAENRSIDYVLLPPSLVEPIPAPDDAALKTYFDAHAQSLAAPQYRKLVVLNVSPSTIARPDEVSDADAKALYDKEKDKHYATPERRTVQQIVFPSDTEAAAAAARLKSGTSFADLLTERKLEAKDIDLGTVTREQLFDKAVAAAAFSLPQDGTSEPIAGAFGPVLIHVTAVMPAGITPFEQVSAALKQEIATTQAAGAMKGLHDKIEDARSAGKPLAEAAQSVGLDGADDRGRRRSRGSTRAASRSRDSTDERCRDQGRLRVRRRRRQRHDLRAATGARPGSRSLASKPRVRGTLDEVRAQVEAGMAPAGQRQAPARQGDRARRSRSQDGQSVEQISAKANGNLARSRHANDVKRTGAPGLAGWALVPAGLRRSGRIGRIGPAAGWVAGASSRCSTASCPRSTPTRRIRNRWRTATGMRADSQDVLLAYLSKYGARGGHESEPGCDAQCGRLGRSHGIRVLIDAHRNRLVSAERYRVAA